MFQIYNEKDLSVKIKGLTMWMFDTETYFIIDFHRQVCITEWAEGAWKWEIVNNGKIMVKAQYMR